MATGSVAINGKLTLMPAIGDDAGDNQPTDNAKARLGPPTGGRWW